MNLDDLVRCAECGYSHPARYCYHRPGDSSVWLCRGCMEERVVKLKAGRPLVRIPGSGETWIRP